MIAARDSAYVFRGCFRSLADETELEPKLAAAVEQRALVASSDAFLALRAGERDRAASVLLDLWSKVCTSEIQRVQETLAAHVESQFDALATALAGLSQRLDEAFAARWSSFQFRLDADDVEWRLLYNQAIEQVVAHEPGIDSTRTALRALMTRLDLSQDDLGRMLGVSGETIRRWERGATGIPAGRRALILAAEAGLRRLQDLFRPERLPTAVRRPAELFDGERALDWILRGRIAEVADRYETALLYQA